MKWRAFPLHPDTPKEGIRLEDLFRKKGIPVSVDKMKAQMKAAAKKRGLELGDRNMTYNSRLAQEVGLWAEDQGKGHAFHMAAFRAYFVDGKNLADRQVLVDLIEQTGLDKDKGLKVIEDRIYSDAVDRDWNLSRQKGVNAVPTFFMGLDKLVGAQPHEAMERMVEKYIN